jgi:TonB family protein
VRERGSALSERLGRRDRRRSDGFVVADIARWKAAIENYVPSVRPEIRLPGDRAMRVAFARYLNEVHNRLHPVFGDAFLVSLDTLPSSHPLNTRACRLRSTVVLDRDGKITRVGVIKPSGVTAFDLAALESFARAQPFGEAPAEIVSPDGHVYFHWELSRNMQYACSTYFAHPFLLKAIAPSAR